jgi:SAM-dependent methyltransferase
MDQCLLCDGTTRTLFSHRGFDLNWCTECDFGRLIGHFTPELVASFYGPTYYTHQEVASRHLPMSIYDRALIHLAWRADWGKSFSPDELGAARSRRACDIGCGGGHNLKQLKEAGFHSIGFEPDERARIRAAKIASVFNGTAENPPHEIAADRFDIVLMSHVLEHCIDPPRAIYNARHILAEGGRLVIEVPNNAAHGFRTFGPDWPWTDIPRHLNFFTEKSLTKMLRSAGLHVETVYYVGYARQFLPEWLPRNSWFDLLATAFSSRSRKYDSVRVHAVRCRVLWQ